MTKSGEYINFAVSHRGLLLLPEEVYTKPFHQRRKYICHILQGLGPFSKCVEELGVCVYD